jgi:hypothetical protein
VYGYSPPSPLTLIHLFAADAAGGPAVGSGTLAVGEQRTPPDFASPTRTAAYWNVATLSAAPSVGHRRP